MSEAREKINIEIYRLKILYNKPCIIYSFIKWKSNDKEMSKCRICLRTCKRLRSLHDTKNGITFLTMINSFVSINLPKENTYPDQICVYCCNKMTFAYEFREEIKRSEIILNENAKLRRLCFDNITDTKISLTIDSKPTLSSTYDFLQDFMYNNSTATIYKNITINKIKENKNSGDKNELTVKEFLESVKLESDDDCYNQKSEVYSDYDPKDSDNDDPTYNYGTSLNDKKKHKKLKDRKKNSKGNTKKPIKPVYIKDIKICHHERKKVNRQVKQKSSVKKSICPYCGKLLRNKYLNTHILNHNSERTYKCDQCPKAFVTEKFLKYHKKKHSSTAEFKCDQCLSSFNCKLILRAHMAVHSDAKDYICDICTKAFKRKYALRTHMLIHKFGAKSIQCELCPMTFHFKQTLNHHMRIHTRERPYRCDICSQPYSYKHDFNRHCFKKHGVFLKRRSVNVMNEEVLKQERALMRELTLRAQGLIKSDELPSVFVGPLGVIAFEAAMKAVKAREIPITCEDAY